ncbi:hypothetical protein [Pseudoxanthomonas wuyuanensis]|uniref:Uncharacterized protein n=1 Tax=Pseudoxanthomonas wuyuanensis TaxID=1073196 RepID=A0A286CYL4_9GAMM|nr:hypothetical protein [Pseudoxanthomonas wuyuanensis]SOD51449.1 hypothetical protein SAMN06296416_101628 [Pseudoxanthomonas wuyuanensis]
MRSHSSGMPRATAAALLFAVAAVAAASEAGQQPIDNFLTFTASPVEIQASLPPADDRLAASAFGTPLDAVRLHQLRGGDSQVNNDILVDGAVNDNTADRIVSGANTINGGSFANASGINTVIQNTGSNVLIQNAMIVNVQFADPGP